MNDISSFRTTSSVTLPAVLSPTVLLSRQATFSAGLKLRHPQWSTEVNRQVFGRSCGWHGAEFCLRVALRGMISPDDGMIVDLAQVKPELARVVALIEDKFLDEDISYFQLHRPTSENVARFLWQNLPESISCGKLYRLELDQSGGIRVAIRVHLPSYLMQVSHSYEFAAAHRLFVPSLTDQENWEKFDKCSNRAGHGHNFQLRVWIEGMPDKDTGFIINPRLLDSIVNEEVYARFDHKHLNEDCPEFAHTGLVPTSENLALTIFGLLRKRLDTAGYKLARIGLQETQKNYFEVEA